MRNKNISRQAVLFILRLLSGEGKNRPSLRLHERRKPPDPETRKSVKQRLHRLAGYICLLTLVFLSASGPIGSRLQAGTVTVFEIPVGGRSAGLAGTVTGLPDDLETAFVNPANAARLKGIDWSFHNIFWLGDMDRMDASFSIVAGLGVVFGGVRLFLPGHVSIYDDWGYEKSASLPWDGLFSAGYSMKVWRVVDAGASVTAIHRYFDPGIDDFGAFSAGLTARFRIPGIETKSIKIRGDNLSAGVAIRNLFIASSSDSLPVELRAGFFYAVFDGMSMGADYGLAFNAPDRFSMAIEFNHLKMFFLQTGYVIDGKTGLSFTAGATARFVAGPLRCGLQYSFLTQVFGIGVHSIGLQFHLADSALHGRHRSWKR